MKTILKYILIKGNITEIYVLYTSDIDVKDDIKVKILL